MNGNQDKFEDYRRERNKRRMDQGPLRAMGKNANVLRELEEREQQEVRNQQLTREVHEFFEEATRTAADIVTKVAQDQEEIQENHICTEMAEFLQDAITRAQELISILKIKMEAGGEAQREMDANMLNLVGQQLDEFRFEGTAQVDDKHIGLDPTGVEDPPPSATSSSSSTKIVGYDEVQAEPPRPVDSDDEDAPLAAELVAEEASMEPAAASTSDGGGSNSFFDSLRDDPEKLREMLKLMVRGGQMTKDEAVQIYRSTVGAK